MPRALNEKKVANILEMRGYSYADVDGLLILSKTKGQPGSQSIPHEAPQRAQPFPP